MSKTIAPADAPEPGGQHTFEYDPMGRLVLARLPDGTEFRYRYHQPPPRAEAGLPAADPSAGDPRNRPPPDG